MVYLDNEEVVLDYQVVDNQNSYIETQRAEEDGSDVKMQRSTSQHYDKSYGIRIDLPSRIYFEKEWKSVLEWRSTDLQTTKAKILSLFSQLEK